MDKLKIFNNKLSGKLEALYEEAEVLGMNNSKPSLGVLSDNEMVMFTCHFHYEDAGHGGPYQIKHSVMYRSNDGGKTWGKGEHMPFEGYEPTVTVIDGILFVQTHVHPNIVNGYSRVVARIYRSDDKGKTWTELKITPQYLGLSEDTGVCPSRNFLKLKDGTIIIYIFCENGFQCRLSSKDKGISWEVTEIKDTVKRNNQLSIMCEAIVFTTPSDRLMGITRIELSDIADDTIPFVNKREPFDTDEGMGMLLIESKDNGITWDAVRGLGYGAMHYPSVVYLDNETFVLTYTQRVSRVDNPYPHTGVQAVIGKENPDGSFDVNFDENVIILDDKSPDEVTTSDGFGMTNLLSDGTMITPYCYAVMEKEYEKMIKSEECFKTDDVFYDYYIRCGKTPDMEWWRRSVPEWKRVIIHECAVQLKLCNYKTNVMRWKINK